MRLSMWIIKDFLKQYAPESYIQSGKMELRSVRILSETQVHVHDNLYLGYVQDYIDNEQGKVICVHKKDMLILQTTDIHEVFNCILDCFDFYNMWEAGCLKLIQDGCSLQSLLDNGKTVFHDRLYVVDRSYVISAELPIPFYLNAVLSEEQKKEKAFYSKINTQRSLPLEYITHVRQKKTIHFLPGVPVLDSVGNGISPNYIIGLFCDGQLNSYLIEINFNTPPSAEKEQLFTVMGELLEKWMQSNQHQEMISDEKSSPGLHALFKQIFLSDSNIETDSLLKLQSYLDRIGWLPSSQKRIYVINNQYNDREILLPLCRELNTHMEFMADCVENHSILIVNESLCSMEKSRSVLAHMLRSTNCCAGASYQFSDILQFPENMMAAKIALTHGSRESGSISGCDDYILSYLKDMILKNMGMEFSHPAAKILLNYDREHQTMLSDTLSCFILNERSYSKTAQELYVHRNTVQYRIGKILELTELDLENRKTRIHMLISLLLSGE
ncbi:MAG: helix-turn-helix domain-containing protein [Lachnospiraceae bacterium]